MNRRKEFGGRKRLSLITDVLIFLILLNGFILLFNYFSLDLKMGELESLAMKGIDFEDRIYIECREIKNKYGINIVYGEESANFASKVNATVQKNEEIIYKNIMEIKKTLSKYPDTYFKDNNLTIAVLNKFNNNNIALASRNKLNEFKIYISNNDTYERSLHHELYHVFEYKININSSDIFENWENLNPPNFEYEDNVDNLDNKYVYDKYIDDEEIYFVTKYSKASEKEDRAEIFAEIMVFKDKPDYLNDGKKLNKKATSITEFMTYSLKDKNIDEFFWNRF